MAKCAKLASKLWLKNTDGTKCQQLMYDVGFVGYIPDKH